MEVGVLRAVMPVASECVSFITSSSQENTLRDSLVLLGAIVCEGPRGPWLEPGALCSPVRGTRYDEKVEERYSKELACFAQGIEDGVVST